MTGETDLDMLLGSMRPALRDGVFVFVMLSLGTARPRRRRSKAPIASHSQLR